MPFSTIGKTEKIGNIYVPQKKAVKRHYLMWKWARENKTGTQNLGEGDFRAKT